MKSPKEDKAYLQDILQAIGTIRSYTSGMNAEKFKHDHMVMDAVIRQLAIVGEAASHLPEELRKKDPQIPWKSVVGMRNILVHAYAEVDEGVVWNVVQNDLEALENGAKRLLAEK